MPARLDIKEGDRYGRLVIVCGVAATANVRRFECLCDCGKTTVVPLNHLRNGHTKSCGCLRVETAKQSFYSHGARRTRLWRIWSAMKYRCNAKRGRAHKYYASRGIKVCKTWYDFKEFQKWALTNGYQDDLTIERININGNYEPANCTWIPQAEQTKNSRHNVFVIYNGTSMLVTEAIRLSGINRKHYYRRIKTMSPEEALSIPVKKQLMS